MERNPNLDSKSRPEGTSSPSGSTASRSPFRSLRRLSVIAKRPEGRNGELTEALEADTLLLREENARLRVKLEAPPNVGHVIERLRALPTPSTNGDNGNHTDNGEDAWQMLTEVLVMRNSLIEICREIGQVMAGLETSLEALSPPDGYVGDEKAGNGSPRNGLRRNGHLKEALS